MTPESLAKSGTEAGHQSALFCWAALELHNGRHELLRWLHAIPNGGARGDDEKTRKIRGGQLKAQGVKAGVADVFLPVLRLPYSGLYIEMKKPDQRPKTPGAAGGLSDDQIEFRDFVQAQGFAWAVCYSWEDARDTLLQYLALPEP